MGARNFRQGTLVVRDGDTPANELTVPCMDATLRWTEDRPAPIIMCRGDIHSRASAPQNAMEVTFEAQWVDGYQGKSASGSDPSVVDALTQQGNASAWVSSDPGPFAVDLIFTISKPENPSATEENEVLTFAGFHLDRLEPSEGEDVNRFAFTGRCLATRPTSVRST